MEVFQEQKFYKPKIRFWERIFYRSESSGANFKETPYLSGDMGYMFLLLKNFKQWHFKIKEKRPNNEIQNEEENPEK